MTEKDDGVLGIIYHVKPDGTISYRCRGIGAKYDLFYRWLNLTSYRCTSEDWPWDFFVFGNAKDHQRLLDNFSAYVSEDKG